MGSVHHLRLGAYVVKRPRATDAVGCALRDAYTGECGIPQDIADLLARLSEHKGGRFRH